MTRKNKVKEKPYNHSMALEDLNVVEGFLDWDVEVLELPNPELINAKESLIRLKKWLESRV